MFRYNYLKKSFMLECSSFVYFSNKIQKSLQVLSNIFGFSNQKTWQHCLKYSVNKRINIFNIKWASKFNMLASLGEESLNNKTNYGFGEKAWSYSEEDNVVGISFLCLIALIGTPGEFKVIDLNIQKPSGSSHVGPLILLLWWQM